MKNPRGGSSQLKIDAPARNCEAFPHCLNRRFIASLSDCGGIQSVGVADAKIVGWCDVTPLPFEGMGHVGRLGMGLLPSFRGQGLGRRLVREALSQVFAKTCQLVELEVFASNKIAVGLYEREGFVIEGRKRFARFLDGAEDDILIMGCLRDGWVSSVDRTMHQSDHSSIHQCVLPSASS